MPHGIGWHNQTDDRSNILDHVILGRYGELHDTGNKGSHKEHNGDDAVGRGRHEGSTERDQAEQHEHTHLEHTNGGESVRRPVTGEPVNNAHEGEREEQRIQAQD